MNTEPCYPEKAPQVNDLLEILSHHLRRETLVYFETHTDGCTATLDELVAYIERQIPRESAASLRVKLAHNHLPKLEDSGWIDYDARSGAVRYHSHDRADQWLGEIQTIFTP